MTTAPGYGTGVPVEVKFFTKIQSIVSIDDTDGSFSAQLSRYSYYKDPRLAFSDKYGVKSVRCSDIDHCPAIWNPHRMPANQQKVL